MSKKLISMFLILTLVLSNVVVSHAATTTAKVTELSGTVKVKRSGSTKEFDAFENMKLNEGDKITTGTDGSVTIVVDDVNVIKAGKSTSFTLKKLSKIGKEPSSAYTIHYGSVTNSVKKKGFSKDSYKVNTTNTVMGVRGTDFEVAKKIAENGEEGVSLVTLDGTVAVSNRIENDTYNPLNEVGSVTADQQIIFKNDDSDDGEIVVLNIDEMDAESLHWLLDNDQYLTEEQKTSAEEALIDAEKIEQEKQETIQKKVDEYSNNPVINTVKPQNDSNYVYDDNDDGDIDQPPTITDPIDPEEPVGPTEPDGNGDGGDTGETVVVKKDYEINNEEEFIKLNNILNTSGSAVVGTVNINADLNLTNVNDWQPAQLDDVTINGNNHTISNLTITNTDNNSNVGLFGSITNSTIQDLKLSSIVTDTSNAEFAGALAGSISTDCVIENIQVDSSIISGTYAGAVTGESYSPLSNIKVTNSSIEGTTIGGVVGALNNTTIEYANVINTTIQENGSVGTLAVGGVVGYGNNATITECVVSGTTNIYGTNGVAGGIVGKADTSTISNVEFNTIGEINAAIKIGGIVGEVSNSAISAAEVYTTDIVARFNSGGIIGVANGTNTVNDVYIEMINVTSINNATSRIVSSNNGVLTINHAISIIIGLNSLNTCNTNTGKITTASSYYCVASENSETNASSKTLAHLQDSSLYSGWDTNVWNIVDGEVPSLK